MNPTFATNRVDLSGWFAFPCSDGTPVIWDGGVNPDMNCLFNTHTLEPIECDWIDELPPIPLVGWLEGDQFVATDSIHPDVLRDILPIQTWPEEFIFLCSRGSLYLPAPFYYSIYYIESLGGRVVTPQITTLPENADAAKEMFQQLHEEADHYARHPNSPWYPTLSPVFVCSLAPPIKRYARLRDFTVGSEGEVVELEFWVGVSQTVKTPPLYIPDFEPGNLTKKGAFTLYYATNGEILGYCNA